VEGSIAFDDGFGTILTQKIRMEHIRSAVINSSSDPKSFWGDTWTDCNRADYIKANNDYWAQLDLKGK
jgi:hypothetical protein